MKVVRSEPFRSLTVAEAEFDDEGNLTSMSAELLRILGYARHDDLSQAILADFYPESEYLRILWEVYPDTIDNGPWCGPVTMLTKTDCLLETQHRIETRSTRRGSFAGFTIRVGVAETIH
jgi:PAS domain-containing protein